MTSVQIVFSTIDSEESALKISRRLVEERLAACVSIIPNVTSVYKWKGATEQARELLMVIKTAQDRVEALTSRLKELHPYEVPEIVAFSIEHGYPPYLDWVISGVAPPAPAPNPQSNLPRPRGRPKSGPGHP